MGSDQYVIQSHKMKILHKEFKHLHCPKEF